MIPKLHFIELILPLPFSIRILSSTTRRKNRNIWEYVSEFVKEFSGDNLFFYYVDFQFFMNYFFLQRIVVPEVAGSNPVFHPKKSPLRKGLF